MIFTDTGLPWVAPSPNLPTPTSALVYPGQVLWEGTNVSEGRGTTQPFELFGAPFLDVSRLEAEWRQAPISGAILRPAAFEPTSNKWQGQCCRGFQIHLTDPHRYAPYTATLRLLQAVIRHQPEQFSWRPPPYEYEYEKLPIDLLIGDASIRQRLENLDPVVSIEASWRAAVQEYEQMRREYQLYP